MWKLIAKDSFPRAAIPKIGGGVVEAADVLTVTAERSIWTGKYKKKILLLTHIEFKYFEMKM